MVKVAGRSDMAIEAVLVDAKEAVRPLVMQRDLAVACIDDGPTLPNPTWVQARFVIMGMT